MPSKVFVDTETTGIGPRARIIELGYVKVTLDAEVEKLYTLPYDRLLVEEGAHKVNNLGTGGRQSLGEYHTTRSLVYKLSYEWRGCELYFNNPGYDMWLIRTLFTEQGADTTWRYHPWDVAALLKGAALVRPNAKLDEVKDVLGIDWDPEPEVHDALEGARLVRRMYDAYEALIGRAGR